MVKASSEGFPARFVDITFHPPDKRKRDLDNCLASFKAGLDGIADALGVNDCQFKLSLEMGSPIKGGEVEIYLS
jgi:crossover junction endodeoxyribonuclease RusA